MMFSSNVMDIIGVETFGEKMSWVAVNSPEVGEYTLLPHAGISSGLGETLIAARSYVFGE